MTRRPPKRANKARARGQARPAKATLQPKQVDTPVTIEKPVYGGAFLARNNGKATFVPLALPGEQARISIVDEKRSFATAEVDEILNPAPERVAPQCPYFGACGGCQYQHATYTAQLRYKQAILRETLERAGADTPGDIEVLAGEPWAYRNRIRLAFDDRGKLGYRSRRSHQIIPIAQCPIAAPVLMQAAACFSELAPRVLPALCSTEIALFCNRDESAILASLFVANSAKAPLDRLADALKEKVPALAGIEIVVEGASGQARRTIAQWGASSLDYNVAGFDYRVDHGAFFQVNRWLVDVLVERVTANQSGALAWDLFAGVGLFARVLCNSFDRVVSVESASAATAPLAHNLAGKSAEAVSVPTLDFLRHNRKADRPVFVVVDPPRTGLGPEVTALLGEIGAPQITYVSCDPATLARDLRALIGNGYSIERVTLVDLFPQTFHLETVVDLVCG
jgi:23S rRNA (uracil1939-C5)-methyltransferase